MDAETTPLPTISVLRLRQVTVQLVGPLSILWSDKSGAVTQPQWPTRSRISRPTSFNTSTRPFPVNLWKISWSAQLEKESAVTGRPRTKKWLTSVTGNYLKKLPFVSTKKLNFVLDWKQMSGSTSSLVGAPQGAQQRRTPLYGENQASE